MRHTANNRSKQEFDEAWERQRNRKGALHNEIDVRYAWNGRREGKRPAYSLYDNQTLRELERFFQYTYGPALPDDDCGLDGIYIAATFIVRLAEAPDQAVVCWAQQWAPWCSLETITAIVDRIFEEKPVRWTADKLAWRVGLTDAVRTLLNIRRIGSTDVDKAARAKRAKEKDRQRQAANRLAAGATPRASSKAKLKKWELMEPPMSRPTWYRAGCPEPPAKRRRRETNETNSSGIDERVCSGRSVNEKHQTGVASAYAERATHRLNPAESPSPLYREAG